MPKAAPRPCGHPGCGRLVPMGGVCPKHPVKAGSFADRDRGTRQQRGYGAEWDRLRAEIMERDAGLCQPCLQSEPERVTRAIAVDHIVSKATAKRMGWSRKQMDAPSNLQAICRDCHDAKTALESQEARL